MSADRTPVRVRQDGKLIAGRTGEPSRSGPSPTCFYKGLTERPATDPGGSTRIKLPGTALNQGRARFFALKTPFLNRGSPRLSPIVAAKMFARIFAKTSYILRA